MTHLLAAVLGWLGRKLGLLFVIIGVLLAVAWLRSEWQQLQALREEIAVQESVLAGLRTDLASLDAAIEADAADWARQMETATRSKRQELESLTARIALAEPRWQEALARFANLERQAQAARRAARVAAGDVAALEREIRFWDRYVNPEKLLALEAARARQAALEANARAWETARDRVAPAIAASPLAPLQAQRSRLSGDIAQLAGSVSPRQAGLNEARSRKGGEIASVEQLLDSQRARAEQDPRGRLVAAIRAQLPLALTILAGVLLMPFLIKAWLYFIVAPLAARRPPIRILPFADASPAPVNSAVSVPVELDPGEELLVQPDFLQSSSRPAEKRTQWLLNAALPFASLASGMFALTRIRPEGGAPTRVIVSSQQDAFGEVGILALPAGAALVLQPRALAGVVKPAGEPVRITRHWRLSSLHAWLTLQLRYLVFHGPCRLVLKGCRGVRSEEPQAGQPRLINQSATLGFSANLDYRTTRSETFVAYLRGKEDLFNDLFAGGPGCFVYEEMPAGGRRGGITGRGLEGATDAVLKAFGI
ncbi:MAG: hypothetical protein MUC71_00235 [Steroidobacteraceae bacterium]|jgi:uncharacterized protein (AIM24 family)|nr:hypothetical protein [Steroidobacteraceae bacterium]